MKFEDLIAKCPKCGSMMSPDKLFCTECGTRLN